jgi:hypothetical protein
MNKEQQKLLEQAAKREKYMNTYNTILRTQGYEAARRWFESWIEN